MKAHVEVTISKRHFNVCVPMSIVIIIIFFFFAFYAKNQDSWESDFWGKSPVDSADTLRVKNFVKITLSRYVSEINPYFRSTQKFKMVAKSGGKTIFGKSRQYSLQIPWGSKILSKSLYLALFPR